MAPEIGVITEQNDLGFGFDPLNPSEQKIYKESLENNTNDKDDKKDK